MRPFPVGAIASLTFGALVFASGCSDQPLAPEPIEVVASQGVWDRLSAGLGSGEVVTVLERRVPLAEDEQASAVVGPEGGVIHLPRAGLHMVFRKGAVAEPTLITLTAPAGNLVGYDFQPHGLQFAGTVLVYQEMWLTNAPSVRARLSLGLTAAYFEGALGASVRAKERRAFRLASALGLFEIEHFSGYVIATD